MKTLYYSSIYKSFYLGRVKISQPEALQLAVKAGVSLLDIRDGKVVRVAV